MTMVCSPRIAAISALDKLDCDDIDREVIRALIIGYAERYQDDDMQAVAVEEEFVLPIINPDSQRYAASRTYQMAGKIDLIVRHEGKQYLCDHKTTSEDISPGSDFWKRLSVNTQDTHYRLALWQMGIEIDGCVWDVVRKPTIRPKRVTKGDSLDIANGTYCGIEIEPGHQVESEDAYLFGVRVLADIREQPDKYYARRFVPRADQELLDYARDLYGTAQLIRDAEKQNRFFKTGAPHACMMYGRSCEYLDLCSGFDHAGNFEQVKPHEELDTVSGLKVLTNSSLGTYRQCQRKYRHRYVDGITKGTSHSLVFGSAFHEVMEAYWSELLAAPEQRIQFGGSQR